MYSDILQDLLTTDFLIYLKVTVTYTFCLKCGGCWVDCPEWQWINIIISAAIVASKYLCYHAMHLLWRVTMILLLTRHNYVLPSVQLFKLWSVHLLKPINYTVLQGKRTICSENSFNTTIGIIKPSLILTLYPHIL